MMIQAPLNKQPGILGSGSSWGTQGPSPRGGSQSLGALSFYRPPTGGLEQMFPNLGGQGGPGPTTLNPLKSEKTKGKCGLAP